MLLPLSKSFQSLKKRLQCINIAPSELDLDEDQDFLKFFGEPHNLQGEMSLENCLRIFDEKQEKINEFNDHRKVEEEAKLRDENNSFNGF